MKMKKTMKIKLLSVAALACAFSACALTLGDNTIAKADTSQIGTISMVKGASLKLNEDGGIRFRAQMDEAFYDLLQEDGNTLYGLITTKENFDAETADGGDYATMESKKIGGELDKANIYKGTDGNYYANVCITGIASTNYTQDFVGIMYAEIAGETEVRYATITDDTRASLYDLVNSATLYSALDYVETLQELTVYDSWYGASYDYAITITTTAQYEAFVAKINEGKDFSDKYVKIYSDVDRFAQLDEGKTLPANVETVNVSTVNFYAADETKVLKTVKVVGTQDVTAPEAPTKATDEDNVYVFDKWVTDDGTEAVLTGVSQNMDVYPSYKEYSLYPTVGKEVEGFENEVIVSADEKTLVTDKVSVYGLGATLVAETADNNTRLKASVNAQESTEARYVVFKFAGLEAGKTYVVDFDMTFGGSQYSFYVNEHGESGKGAAAGDTVNRPTYVYSKNLQQIEARYSNTDNMKNGTDHYTMLFTASKSGYTYFTIRCSFAAADTFYIDNFKIYNQAGTMPAYNTNNMTASTVVKEETKTAVFASGTAKNQTIYFWLGLMTTTSTYTVTFKAEVYDAEGTAVTGKINAFAFGIGTAFGWTSGASGVGSSYALYTPADGTVTITLTPSADATSTYLYARTQDGCANYTLVIWDIAVTAA